MAHPHPWPHSDTLLTLLPSYFAQSNPSSSALGILMAQMVTEGGHYRAVGGTDGEVHIFFAKGFYDMWESAAPNQSKPLQAVGVQQCASPRSDWM